MTHGIISTYAHAISMGLVKTDDGRLLFVSLSDWSDTDKPRPGDEVFFQEEGMNAKGVKRAVRPTADRM